MKCLTVIWHIYANRQLTSCGSWKCEHLCPRAALFGCVCTQPVHYSIASLWLKRVLFLIFFSPLIIQSPLWKNSFKSLLRRKKSTLYKCIMPEEVVWKYGKSKLKRIVEFLLQTFYAACHMLEEETTAASEAYLGGLFLISHWVFLLSFSALK